MPSFRARKAGRQSHGGPDVSAPEPGAVGGRGHRDRGQAGQKPSSGWCQVTYLRIARRFLAGALPLQSSVMTAVIARTSCAIIFIWQTRIRRLAASLTAR
jgi:hypothetical protein